MKVKDVKGFPEKKDTSLDKDSFECVTCRQTVGCGCDEFNNTLDLIGNLEIDEEVSKLLEEKDRIIAELKAEKQTYISDMVDKGNEIYKLKDSCSDKTLRKNG